MVLRSTAFKLLPKFFFLIRDLVEPVVLAVVLYTG